MHIFSQLEESLCFARVPIPPRSPIVHHDTIPTAPSHTRSPLLRDLGWTVNDGEAWAIISDGGGRGQKTIFNISLFVS